MKVAGQLPTNTLGCLFFATLIFSALPGQSICAQDSSGVRATPEKDGLSLHHPPYSGTACCDTDLYLEMAREGLEAKQYKQAARLCERILQKDKVNKEAHFLQGIAYHYLGEHDLAVERLHWVLLLDKDNAVAREYLERSKKKSTSQWSPQEVRLIKVAMQYHEEGLNGLAIGILKEILKQNPQNTEAWELLGDVYKKLGNLTIAKTAYHKANAKEKASEIKGEIKYIPRGWWEGLTAKEAQLHKANLQFVKIRDETARMRGMLSEFDARTREKLDLEAKRMDEKIARTQGWQRNIEDAVAGRGKAEAAVQVQPGQVQVQGGGSGLVVDEKLLSHRPLLKYEIRENEEKKLYELQGTYGEERSVMAEELSSKTKEFIEAKSSMESLEEELKNASLR